MKKEGTNYIITATGLDENLMLAGKPLTWEELVNDVNISEEEYERGECLTTKELRDEAGIW